MAGQFTKQEIVGFTEKLVPKLEDHLHMLKNIDVLTLDGTSVERSGLRAKWYTVPQMAVAYDALPGTSIAVHMKDKVQLAVPARVDRGRGSTFSLNSLETDDPEQIQRQMEAAGVIIASSINEELLNTACLQGSVFIKRTAPASSFADVITIDSALSETGVSDAEGSILVLSPREHGNLAEDLQKASRTIVKGGKSEVAYESGRIGDVAGFKVVKSSYAIRKNAAAGGAGITINMTLAGGNVYVPKATVTTVTGVNNVDNRQQTVTVSSTTLVAVGDSFRIAGVESVHLIRKKATGQDKTYRVLSVDGPTTMTISPPIISNVGLSAAEEQYQNCFVTTPSASHAIVFLNTVTSYMNPFWRNGALNFVTASSVPHVGGDPGFTISSFVADGKVRVELTKSFNFLTKVYDYRMDSMFGTVYLAPEQGGIEMFNQT